MPVEDKHPEYKAREPQWRRSRHAVAGTDAVKGATVLHLPKLGGQDSDEYNAFLLRADYYGASSRTLQGLVGAIFRKPMKLDDVPEAQRKEMEIAVTDTGVGIQEFARTLARETLGIGRYGVLSEMPVSRNGTTTGKPYYVSYKGEDIYNWDTEVEDGKTIITRVVLHSTTFEQDPKDEFAKKKVERLRVLSLSRQTGQLRTQERIYSINVYRKREKSQLVGPNAPSLNGSEYRLEMGPIIPQVRGNVLQEIPFVFFNASTNLPATEKPPMLDLFDINLSHYRSSAMIEHGAMFTALPTAWVAGFPVETKLQIGAGVAWVSEDTQASAGYLEFTGAGLAALERRIEVKERHMAILGARMLEGSRTNGVEAAETVQLRQSGEVSALNDTVNSVEDGLTRLTRYYLAWIGIDFKDKITLNREFVTADLNPQQIIALMQAWQQGGISFETLMFQYERGNVLPAGTNAEDEKKLIAENPPIGVAQQEFEFENAQANPPDPNAPAKKAA